MSEIRALTVPKWGMAMEEGTLVNWLVNTGDMVSAGDPIAEIESSKIVNVLETQYPGVVRRCLLEVDETRPVGALVAVIADAAVPDAAIDAFIAEFRIADEIVDSVAAPAPETTPQLTASPAVPATGGTTVVPDRLKQGGDDSAVNASPHARRLAEELGINLNNITGSGRRGRISVEDIEQAIIAAGGSLGVVDAPDIGDGPVYDEIPFAGMRQTIAKRLQESKQTAPHFRLSIDVEVDALLALRQEINKGPDSGAGKVSVNDMLLKACALALMQAPACNVQFVGDTIRRFRHADIALAVALEEGLITPVLRRVEDKTLTQIAGEARALVERARAGTLAKEDYEGGSFTISNLGMYGIRQFDAIINQPQCAILAVGAAQPAVVARDGVPVVATVIALSLSLDHRIIDGAMGARLLQALAEIISRPAVLNT